MHCFIKNKLLQNELIYFLNRVKRSEDDGSYVYDIHNGVFIIKVFEKFLQKHDNMLANARTLRSIIFKRTI